MAPRSQLWTSPQSCLRFRRQSRRRVHRTKWSLLAEIRWFIICLPMTRRVPLFFLFLVNAQADNPRVRAALRGALV